MFSIIPILIIYLIPIILSGKTVLTKKNLKDLLIYYKDNGYLNPFGWFYCTNALTIGIILHELIHGITWAKYTKDGFKSIRFEYGNS
jgi:hypothetical protein